MANKVTMNICGQEYTLVADESAAYTEKAVSYTHLTLPTT